jgi:uncharacterized oligopeptide transporter (OPT) family protein
MANDVWRYIVRPIAIGGMLMSAGWTLFRMRKSLVAGIGRSIGDVKKAASGEAAEVRTERDIRFPQVVFGILATGVLTFFIYNYFAQNVAAALTATIVMIVAGFFFAAVSGYLVGIIGSCTPWKMEVGDLIGVALASAVMFFPLVILHQGDINLGGTGLGGANYPAPQASLMALLSQGIVGGRMAWPLIIVGMLMALGMILMQVRSPMLVCVGMYLPLQTTFAIFVGGAIKGLVGRVTERRQHNDAQKARVENIGVLLAAGLIAGEALIGLLFAGLAVANLDFPNWLPRAAGIYPLPFAVSLLVFLLIGWVLTSIPVANAGRPDEPAPPSAVM